MEDFRGFLCTIMELPHFMFVIVSITATIDISYWQQVIM